MPNNQHDLYQGESIQRTHDKFYLGENRKDNPKEYFKFIAGIAKNNLSSKDIKAIDIGCATGDFVYFLKREFPQLTLWGMDVDDELLERAMQEVKDVTFVSGDVINLVLPHKFDVIFLNGVHSIFDNLDWIDSLVNNLSDNGVCYIFGLFNPDDLDVLIKSRKALTNDKWETGWNLFSKATVGKYIRDKGFNYKFYDFELNIDLEKNLNDPLRTWTERLHDGSRIIKNGLQLINTLSLLEIKKIKIKKYY